MKRSAAFIGVFALFLFAQAAMADWSASKRLTWTSADSFNPAIAKDSYGTIHVVWDDSKSGNAEVYYRKSTDGGVSWNPVQRPTWTSGYSFNPDVAVDSSDVIHVVWNDDTVGADEIYYRQSDDGGASWSPMKRLTWTSGNSNYPAVAAGPGNTIHIVWHDAVMGSDEICYKKSTDGGATWSTATMLNWTSSWSYTPDLVIDSGSTVHVVWSDAKAGNYEIYYRKGK